MRGYTFCHGAGIQDWEPFCIMATSMRDPQQLCDLLGIRHPLIQAGMVWCTGADLVVAVGRAEGHALKLP
jgi:hypothetical protein